MNQPTFDPSGQYTALIAFFVSLINQYAPYLGLTVQAVVQFLSAVAVLYGIFKAYKNHRDVAITAGVKGI